MRLLTLLFFALLFASCVNAPEYPVEPVLTFERLSKNQIYQFTNGPQDSLQIQFSFTDGDGDLSQLTSDSIDIFLEDSRFPGFVTPFSLPLIPEEGTGNGISGDIFIDVVNTSAQICCVANRRICAEFEDFPIDTFSYSIQIVDRAGNRSNVIRTTPIEILCLNQ